MVDVSIIIINYNTVELTRQCLASVYQKTFGITYEVILVDNASHDRDASELLLDFPHLKLIKSGVNLGFAGGNNLGIKEAKSDFILLLNSDTILKNNAIKISFDKLKSSPQIGALSCKLLFLNGQVQPVAGRFPSLKREWMDFLRLNKGLSQQQRAEVYLGTEFDYKTEREVDWVWGAFFMFPKNILLNFQDGLLPQDFFMYMEDVLWCYRIKQFGYRVLYIPHGEVYHLMGGSSSEKIGNEFERYANKILPNEYAFIKKTHGYWYAKLYYLIKAMYHASLRTKEDRNKSRVFLSLVLR